jgi:hypothetical protein
LSSCTAVYRADNGDQYIAGYRRSGYTSFPAAATQDLQRRIETSLDTDLQSPINYSVELDVHAHSPGDLVIDVSYVGRIARHLLATRDVMAPE